jgi:hypothetical protein
VSVLNSKPKVAKVDPATLYICLASHLGPAGFVREGFRYRGDHPTVVANPQMFVPANLSSEELFAAQRDLNLVRLPEPKPEAKPRARYRCVAGFVMRLGDGSMLEYQVGREVREGDWMLRDPQLRKRFEKVDDPA